MLQFNETGYKATKENIKNFASLLVKASEEIESLNAGSVEPNALKDGNFTERVIEFYRKEWASNTAFKHVSFDKYLQFIELDLTKLEHLQDEYNGRKDYTYSFYPHNHPYFDYCEYRFKEGLGNAGKKVRIKIMDMFKLDGKSITIQLDEKYFELHSANSRQLEKISDIENLVAACRKMGVTHKLVKEALGPWVTDLAYDLERVNINHFYLLKTLQ